MSPNALPFCLYYPDTLQYSIHPMIVVISTHNEIVYIPRSLLSEAIITLKMEDSGLNLVITSKHFVYSLKIKDINTDLTGIVSRMMDEIHNNP